MSLLLSLLLPIFTIIVAELIMSIDNSIFMAVLVQQLDKREQRKALYYGLAGTYIFRILAIIFAVFLIKIVLFKLIGACYLIYLCFEHFYKTFIKKETDNVQINTKKDFKQIVKSIIIVNIFFSIDSILVCVGITNNIFILLTGGALGILILAFATNMFIKVLERIPELKHAAYALIGMIGIRMIFHFSDLIFYSLFISIFIITFIIHHIKRLTK